MTYLIGTRMQDLRSGSWGQVIDVLIQADKRELYVIQYETDGGIYRYYLDRLEQLFFVPETFAEICKEAASQPETDNVIYVDFVNKRKVS